MSEAKSKKNIERKREGKREKGREKERERKKEKERKRIDDRCCLIYLYLLYDYILLNRYIAETRNIKISLLSYCVKHILLRI